MNKKMTWFRVKYPTTIGEINPGHTPMVPMTPWITPKNKIVIKV